MIARFKQLRSIPRLYWGWIVCACISDLLVLSGLITGPNWTVVFAAGLLGFAIGNIEVVRQLYQKRELIDRYDETIRALMGTNTTEIGKAMAAELRRRMGADDDERPTLQ